jgi:hypothetical protein
MTTTFVFRAVVDGEAMDFRNSLVMIRAVASVRAWTSVVTKRIMSTRFHQLHAIIDWDASLQATLIVWNIDQLVAGNATAVVVPRLHEVALRVIANALVAIYLERARLTWIGHCTSSIDVIPSTVAMASWQPIFNLADRVCLAFCVIFTSINLISFQIVSSLDFCSKYAAKVVEH